MRGDSAIVFRNSPIDAASQIALLRAGSVCYDCESRGEVSERLKELASKASVGGTLPWVQIPPSPPFFKLCFHTLTASLLNLYMFCPCHFQGASFAHAFRTSASSCSWRDRTLGE